MKKVSYEHENNSNYLIIDTESSIENVSYQEKMVVKNKIKGLAGIEIKNINNKKKYYYNITSKQQMDKLYEFTRLKYDDVKMVCSSISAMIKEINKYMLDADYILLKPEFMFVNMLTHTVEFVYYPEEKRDFSNMLKELFEYILEKYDHSTDKMELMHIYNAYQKIIQGAYDLEYLDRLCDDSEKEIAEMQQDNTGYEYEDISEDYRNKDIQLSEKKDLNKEKSIVIESVQNEKVTSEHEKSVSQKEVLEIVRIILALAIVYLTVSVFIPKIAVLKINIYVSICIVAVLLLAIKKISEMIKTQRYSGKIVESSDNCEYEIHLKNEEEKQEERDIQRQIYETEIRQETEDDLKNFSKRDAADIHSSEDEMKADNGNTVLLSEYLKELQLKENDKKQKDNRVLRFIGENEELEINEFPCIVGSMKEYCMKVVENQLISRMHMCVFFKEERWYIEDMNSTNGTYLNDKRMMPGEEKELLSGDVVTLAATSYTVEIS